MNTADHPVPRDLTPAVSERTWWWVISGLFFFLRSHALYLIKNMTQGYRLHENSAGCEGVHSLIIVPYNGVL